MQASYAISNMIRREGNVLQHDLNCNRYTYKGFWMQVLNPENNEKADNLNLHNP